MLQSIKMNKKEQKEFRLKFAKETLEQTKNVYETFLEVLIEYNMSALGYNAIKTAETYQRELLLIMKTKSFTEMIFGKPGEKRPTELEEIEEDKKYYDDLIKIIESRIKNFPYDIKKKIANDAVKKEKAWYKLLEFNNELVVKKKKIKVSGSYKKKIKVKQLVRKK